MAGTIHQPIHPSILPRLDPEYAEFHDKHIASIVPPHTIPWHPDIRNVFVASGESPIVEVGSVRDIALQNCKIRVYTPEGAPPSEGWPVYLYMHGGGWTFGNLATQASYASRQTKENSCLTICLDYRLAPENPYPAAVIDTVDTLQWIQQNGKAELNANINKIAVGGSSRYHFFRKKNHRQETLIPCGGNLAAIVALKAQELNPPIPILFQLLVVPASDSGDIYPSWKEMKDAVWLNTGRMMWFRHMYLPDPATWTNWDSSPIFAPEPLLANAPPAWIAVSEMDILRDEGMAYGEKLRSLGVEVATEIYAGAPHQIQAMDGVMAKVRIMVADATKALGYAFKNA